MRNLSASQDLGAEGAIPELSPSKTRVHHMGTSVVSSSMCFFEWGGLGRGLAVWVLSSRESEDVPLSLPLPPSPFLPLSL